MAHDSHDAHDLPVIPFTPPEAAAMVADDIKTAKVVGSLTGGIFLLGLVLYIGVLISVIAYSPVYAIR